MRAAPISLQRHKGSNKETLSVRGSSTCLSWKKSKFFYLDSEPLFLQGHAIYILCFADDLLLLAAGIEGLQRSMDKLAHYCDVWGLEINISKTKAMQVCKPGKKLDPLGAPTLTLNNDTVEWVTSFSYLGVEVTNRGNLQTATAPMKAKANRAQFKLSKLVRSLSFDTKLWLHQTMVDPILLHGAEVWIAQNRASLVRNMESTRSTETKE